MTAKSIDSIVIIWYYVTRIKLNDDVYLYNHLQSHLSESATRIF